MLAAVMYLNANGIEYEKKRENSECNVNDSFCFYNVVSCC
jgi:hypothetical protein